MHRPAHRQYPFIAQKPAPAMPKMCAGWRLPPLCRWLPRACAHRTLCPAGRRHCGLDPCALFESIGYRRNLVVLTQAQGLCKKENKFLPAIRARYLRYPAFLDAVADRHERYNETLSYLSMLEQAGQDYVIRPRFRWRSAQWSGTRRPAAPCIQHRPPRRGKSNPEDPDIPVRGQGGARSLMSSV